MGKKKNEITPVNPYNPTNMSVGEMSYNPLDNSMSKSEAAS